jgi:SAM-dependent methyltransferase
VRMRLGPEGLFLTQRLEGLIPPVFEELIERAEPFALKVDYPALPPPLGELDLVHLVPALAAALPLGSLVLRRVSDGFEFCRVAPGNHTPQKEEQGVARVVRVERPGTLIRLDTIWWQMVGSLLVRFPGFAQVFEHWSRLQVFIGKLAHPFPCPVNLGPPERLVEEVIRKYSHPDEVRYQVMHAPQGLEAWEERLFARVLQPPARLLVVGCGVGREAIPLAARGFRVVGIDPVPDLIAAARRTAENQGLDITFDVMAAHDLDFPAGWFDAVVCSGGVYEQTPTKRRRVELLRGLGRLMVPAGVLVLAAGWCQDVGPRLALVDGLRRLLRRSLGERFPTEPGDRLIRHLSFASDANVQCFFHVFQSPEEIHREIIAAGWIGEMDPEGFWILRKA